jgi:ribosomal protein S18 acetylase RimI-like enzyme
MAVRRVGQAMIDPAEAETGFDSAFSERAPATLRVRPEQDGDADFLRGLFLATNPLRDVLPDPMLAHQADFQLAAFRSNYPHAVRRIVLDAAAPIGRIIIDCNGETSHCVDIAVHPAHAGRGVGTALLQAWIAAATRHGLACTLTVAPDNPARALYARLGFHEEPAEVASAVIAMVRPPYA